MEGTNFFRSRFYLEKSAPMQFAPIYPFLYRLLAPTFPNCLWRGRSDRNQIALTFDDGPHPEYTPQLLKVLERYDQVASFFCLGSCVRTNPEVVREISQRGHWLGLHGYKHKSFPSLSQDEVNKSLLETRAAIASVTDIEPDRLVDVRPPNGLFTPAILKQLENLGYRVVMWSLVSEDWRNPGIEVICDRVTNQIKNGANIVLHDGYYGGGKDIAAIVANLIPHLLDRGYQFVSINDFWQQKLELSNSQ